MSDATTSGEPVIDLDHIRTTVRAAITAPDGPFPVQAEDVRGQDLPVFVDRHRSLSEFFDYITTTYADRDYLVLEDQRMTYADFAAAVSSCASALVNDHGVAQGDRVALFAANAPEWVVVFAASARIGAVVAAFNGWWTTDEAMFGLELVAPTIVVGDTKRLARIADFDGTVIDFETNPGALRHDGAPVEPAAVAEDDPAIIMFTSGTTGRPKGAVVSHRGLIGFVQCQQVNVYEKIKQASAVMGVDIPMPSTAKVVLATSPLFHVSGLHAGILLQGSEGATLVYRHGRFDPHQVLALMEQEGVTNWGAMGAMANMVLDALEAGKPDGTPYDVSSVTGVGFGGAPTSESLAQRIREGFPSAAASVGSGYGSTESVAVITGTGGQEWAQNPTSAGRTVINMDLSIRDVSGTEVPDGVEGDVWVRSAYSMTEYWQNPEATAETITSDGWLAMGDIGRVEDGVLYLNSRARDMIIRSAENIYPVEIEHRIEAHPQVAEAAVYGVDHDVLGQEVKAVVVPVEGVALDEATLSEWCADTLSGYKVPSLWEVRSDPLPRNATGKVVKGVLMGERTLDQLEE